PRRKGSRRRAGRSGDVDSSSRPRVSRCPVRAAVKGLVCAAWSSPEDSKGAAQAAACRCVGSTQEGGGGLRKSVHWVGTRPPRGFGSIGRRRVRKPPPEKSR